MHPFMKDVVEEILPVVPRQTPPCEIFGADVDVRSPEIRVRHYVWVCGIPELELPPRLDIRKLGLHLAEDKPHILCRPTERVIERRRVVIPVGVRVPPARKPDGIRLDVPPGLRIVVAEVVVEEVRLLVQILARQYLDRPLPKERFSG